MCPTGSMNRLSGSVWRTRMDDIEVPGSEEVKAVISAKEEG